MATSISLVALLPTKVDSKPQTQRKIVFRSMRTSKSHGNRQCKWLALILLLQSSSSAILWSSAVKQASTMAQSAVRSTMSSPSSGRTWRLFLSSASTQRLLWLKNGTYTSCQAQTGKHVLTKALSLVIWTQVLLNEVLRDCPRFSGKSCLCSITPNLQCLARSVACLSVLILSKS